MYSKTRYNYDEKAETARLTVVSLKTDGYSVGVCLRVDSTGVADYEIVESAKAFLHTLHFTIIGVIHRAIRLLRRLAAEFRHSVTPNGRKLFSHVRRLRL